MGEHAKSAYYNIKLASLKASLAGAFEVGYRLSSPLEGL